MINLFKSVEVKGDLKTQRLLSLDFCGQFMANLLIAYTDPAIRIYMVSNIDPIYFKVSLLVGFIIGIMVNLNFNKDTIPLLRKYYSIFVVVDVIISVSINVIFGDNPDIRMLSFAILAPLTTAIEVKIFNDCVNNAANGSNLTVINERKLASNKLAFVVGISLSILIPDIDVYFALYIQCLGIIIACVSSLFVRNKMMKIVFNDKENSNQ